MKTLQSLQAFKSALAASILLFILLGCDSSDTSNEEGYIKLYNLSNDAPGIHLVVDEDFSQTSEDEDHYENTFSSIAYGDANTNIPLASQDYYYQLAWQDGDSNATEDLAVLYESSLEISAEMIHMIVLNNSILSPQVTVHSFPVIDDEDDNTNDLFNLRVLNIHTNQQAIDFYLSKENESFNEAVLIGQFAHQQLSDNQKLDQDDYVFYITLAGSDEVLFRSKSIAFAYSSQNIVIVKDNYGAGTSPYVVDKMSDSTVIEYVDADAEAQFSAYNGVSSHQQLVDYQQNFSMHINGITSTPAIDTLAFGEVSNAVTLASGDYSIDLTNEDNSQNYLSNQLLSVAENSNNTLFFYAEETYIDADNDGDIDENGDGVIDEIAVNLYSLIVENSPLTSSYEHEIEIVNLIQSDEFSSVTVYFVRADETIGSAQYHREISYKNTNDVLLKNNSYQVFVVAKENSSSIILNTFDLVLNEQSSAQFLVLEKSDAAPTGYKTTLFNQSSEQGAE